MILGEWAPAIPQTEPDSNPPLNLTGRPPARTVHELAHLLRTIAAPPAVMEATAAWLSGERRAAPATIRGYVRDASWWIAYATSRGLDLTNSDPIEADLYAAALRSAGHSDATRARRISAASSWYTYLVRAGRAAANPFGAGMERPRLPDVSATRGMSGDELERTLAYARERESARTFAILAVMVATACRDGSIIAAPLDALGHDRGHRVIDLPTKGGKTKRLILPPLAAEAAARYLTERGSAPGRLFITSTGRPIDQPYLYRLVKRVTRAAGVAEVSPHGIRHSVLTLLLDKGYPLHVVQDLAGHADPRTTRRYDRARESLDRSPAYELGQLLAAGVERHAGRWS
ncbi:tyrosine-type recombinase/integrase [Nonomuraea sp. NPDC048882]|uniref:tyrosine-type recombinase/integrase n=1 Tax=Nonomuraea sp. NPDC048882 TaxID=3154347 RepID=UPI0033F9777F